MLIIGNSQCKFCRHIHPSGYICKKNIEGRLEMKRSWRAFLDTIPHETSTDIERWADDGGLHPWP